MLYWLLDLTYDAASKAQSFKTSDVNEKRLVSPHTVEKQQLFRAGECWRATQLWLQESRLGRSIGREKYFSAIGWKTPWALGHRSWEAFRAETQQTSQASENLLSLYPGDNSAESCLNISWGTRADHWQGMLLQNIWQVLRREQNMLWSFFFFWYSLSQEENLPPPASQVFSHPKHRHSTYVQFVGDTDISQINCPCASAKGKLFL